MGDFLFSTSNNVELYLVNIGPLNASNSRTTIWALALVDELDHTNGVVVSLAPKPMFRQPGVVMLVLTEPKKLSLPSPAKSGSFWTVNGEGATTTTTTPPGSTSNFFIQHPPGWVVLSYTYIGKDRNFGGAMGLEILKTSITDNATNARACWRFTNCNQIEDPTAFEQYAHWLTQLTQDWATRACLDVNERLGRVTAVGKDLSREGLAKELDAAMVRS